MFRRLLIAFDGSSHAQRALAEAIELAGANSGGLTVMTVVPEPSAWALDSYGTPVDLSDLSKQIEREYQTMLVSFAHCCSAASATTSSKQAQCRCS